MIEYYPSSVQNQLAVDVLQVEAVLLLSASSISPFQPRKISNLLISLRLIELQWLNFALNT